MKYPKIKLKLLLVSAFLVLVPLWMKIVSYLSHGDTTCIFDAIGIPCFGCGILGALNSLLKGDIKGSFNENPLVFLWLLAFVILIGDELYHWIRRIIIKDNTLSLVDKLLKKMF